MGRRFEALEGPAIELAHSLGERGYGDAAGLLLDVLPAEGTVVNSDEQRSELTHRLSLVAHDLVIPPALAAEAKRLAAVAQDLATALSVRGTVWIAWMQGSRRDPGSPSSGYAVHWEGPAGDPDLYEEGADTPDLRVALAWAWRRARRVIVRPSWDPDTSYWAGQDPPPDDLPLLPHSS